MWLPAELREDKFDAMMAVLDKEVPGAVQRKLSHIIVVDQAFEVFSRIWVMAEIAKGQELELNQVAMLFPPPQKLQAASKARRSVVPASAAAEIGRVRATLDIRKCKASRQEDVDAILSSIPDVEKFNEQLKAILFNESSGILETWSAERCAGFFDVIDPLKELVEREHWSAPQVIMLGQESTGKSTLLERLTGLPIFPRNADLCTRSLIKVCLRRGPTRKLKLLVQDILTQRFDDEGSEIDLEELGDEVMKEMTRQVRLESLRQEVPDKDAEYYSAAVSEKPLQPSDGLCTKKALVIELSSPKAPNLDVVDCPGLVAASARGRPADVAQETASLVRTFAKKHRNSALFVVAVKASEQPNNSLAMRLVQELGLESRALGVLTMTDVLTGDLTDRETTLHTTFLKHHGPRLLQLLRGATDAGGGVPLALGYTLTALNDIHEDRGWLSLSRVDAMAQWEVQYFKQLATQWVAAARASVQSDTLDEQFLLQRCSCNSLWRHIKDAVDNFVRDNWLSDTVRLAQEQEALTASREQSLGLPRAMALHHIAELCFQSDLLPASLRAVATFAEEDAAVCPGDKLSKFGYRALSSPKIPEIFANRIQAILQRVLASPWRSDGFFHELLLRLEDDMLHVIPEAVTLGPPGNGRVFDWPNHLESCLRQVEQQLLRAVLEVKTHVQSKLDAALQEDKTPERIGRLSLAIASFKQLFWQDIGLHECLPGKVLFATFPLKGIREALGIADSLEACPLVRVERLAPAFTFSLKLDAKQITNRCSLHFHRFLEDLIIQGEQAPQICKRLPEDCWIEDCTEERLKLLCHLQNLRLAQARLKDAFGEEHFEKAAACANSTQGNALEPDARKKAAAAETVTRRSHEEVRSVVSSWRNSLHARAADFFSSAAELDSVLEQVAENTDAGTDFLQGDGDVLWRGECSGSEAFLWIKRDNASDTQTYVNRVLAALFIDDESFDRLSTLPKEPFKMTCGNQRCINLLHLDVP